MEFCDKCGKPLKIKENLAICPCGFAKQASQVYSSEKIEKPVQKGKGIFKEETSGKGFPHKCKKCGHDFADVVDLGVFYSDESSVHLFTCKKCKNTERDAYGSSNA